MGMGPVGLITVAAAKSFGVQTIIVTDLEEVRLEAARRMGATHTINVRDEDALAVIRDITGGIGVDTAWRRQVIPRRCNPLYIRFAEVVNWRLLDCLHRMRLRLMCRLLLIMKSIFMAYSLCQYVSCWSSLFKFRTA